MSFNRPHYLRQVLESLMAQRDAAVEEREVFLFQDGAINAYSGRVCAEEADIDACVEMFREHFPRGHVMRAPKNIGVAENFLRAETHLFRDLKAERGYFFEDDLVLTPRYLETLERLGDAAAKTDKVGYFACYGKLAASLEQQHAQLRSIARIEHFWAFGLFRSHWEEMQPHLADYYSIVIGNDYRHRPHKKIMELYRSKGIYVGVSSQDDIKASVTHKLGRTGINTFAVNARYIGAEGLHFTPASFALAGYDRTAPVDVDRLDFDFPSDEELVAMRDEFIAIRKRHIELEAVKVNANELPPPHMSAAERELFSRVLASGRRRYAEFGTGGSTRLAALAGLDLMVSVESDPAWAAKVRKDPAVGEMIAAGKADILHADIGPVKAWGAPVDRTTAEKWPTYIARMWDRWAARDAFPDLVLIDGRFRVASCLSVALLHAARAADAEAPLVLMHDLSDARAGYKRVFEAFRVIEHVETLCLMTPRDDVQQARVLALMLSRLAEVH